VLIDAHDARDGAAAAERAEPLRSPGGVGPCPEAQSARAEGGGGGGGGGGAGRGGGAVPADRSADAECSS